MRAGSTLLRTMLDRHPRICAPPEIHALPFKHLDDRALFLAGTDLVTGLPAVLQHIVGLDPEAAAAKVDQMRAEGINRYELFEYLQSQTQADYLVDKSPVNSWSADRVLPYAEHFEPRPLYIFLTRHPVAVIESVVRNDIDRLVRRITLNAKRAQRYRADPESVPLDMSLSRERSKDRWAVGEYLWARCNGRTLSFLDAVPSARQVTLSYESLVTDPPRELTRVCQLLELEFDEAMLDPYLSKRTGTRLTPRELGNGDGNFLGHGRVRTELAERWQERLTENPALGPASVCLAEAMGYQLPAPLYSWPISSAQDQFLRRSAHRPWWVLHLSCSVTLDTWFDRARLGEALLAVVRRHPALRCAFARDSDGWRQRIERPSTVDEAPIEVLDAPLNASAAIARALEQLELRRAPLLRVLVLDSGDGQLEVHYLLHHLVCDGVSALIVHQQLWEGYLDSSPSARPHPSGESYGLYLETMTKLRAEARDHLSWWLGAIGEAPQRTWPTSIYADERELQTTLTLASEGRTRYHFYAIAVALYRAVGDLMSKREVVLAHRLSRRRFSAEPGSVHAYSRVVGLLAGDVALGLDLDDTAALATFERRFRAMPLGGATHEWLVLDGALAPASESAPVRLNYFPLRPQSEPTETWGLQATVYNHQQNDREYEIEFIVHEKPPKLRVTVRYSEPVLDHAGAKGLVRGWFQHLRALT